MTSARKCCVPSCGLDNKILHRFPNPDKEPDRFKKWLYNIGGDILALDYMHIYKNRKVCHLHFENLYHTWTKSLTHNAVPTLCLSGDTLSVFHKVIFQILYCLNKDFHYLPTICHTNTAVVSCQQDSSHFMVNFLAEV